MAIELRIRKGERLLPTRRMTYEQFLEWADEDTNAEWVDGEVELMSPASVQHQDLAGFLYRLFSQWLEDVDRERCFRPPSR